ncbi:hypothetical protein F5144DRAFT_372150 [Chaetomium tenue]|uniref:Uncharacterized protein n=1 Tax=Chaetomium tenue TaxID=1854479 RepID=A0ACB7NZD7_9PEZI|nr:hypothetical protein F5144DRAFT_372150 [Chaetomium globosum]
MAASSLHEPPKHDRQNSESFAVAATFPPPRSPAPKPDVALPGSTHHQPESPCSLSKAPKPRLPRLVPLRATIQPPQPGSIQAILREQCRSRLYVSPIAWTSNQPRLLGCDFAIQMLGATGERHGGAEKESTTQQRTEKYQERIFAAANLQGPAIASWWKGAVEDFLGTYNIRPLRSGSTLPFRFGDRVVAKIKPDAIFSAGSTAPFLVYINLETIAALREKHVYSRSRVGRRHSFPVATLKQKKLRSLQPRLKTEDPYILAALIALAQEQQLQSRQATHGRAVDAQAQLSRPSETEAPLHDTTSFKVHALVVSGANAQVLYVYKASIPSEFLENFQKPSQFSPSCPIRVSYCLLPLTRPEELVDQIPLPLKVPIDEQGDEGEDPSTGGREHVVAH